MSISGHAVNILQTYFRASKDEFIEGLRWYDLAREEISARLDVPLATGCGIVAALSPQTPWNRNIAIAERFVKGLSCGSTRKRLATAQSILDGLDPLNALTGPKTNAFYRCLRGFDDGSVCVDGHAFSVWHGRFVATSQTPKIRGRLYETIAADYREAARVVGLKPHQIQAVTWLTWRRLHPRSVSRKLASKKIR